MSLTSYSCLPESTVTVLGHVKYQIFFPHMGISFEFQNIINIRTYTDILVFTTTIFWLTIN